MKVINDKWFEDAAVKKLHDEFSKAQPYPHIHIDGLLDEAFADTLLANFPKKEDMRRHYKGLNEEKSEGSNFDIYHESFRTLRAELAQPRFIGFLEKMTGIEGLLLPEDYRGAGVHQGSDGSFLDIHVDFNIHPVQNILRRLNFLVFLNKGWKEEYGGKLELWDKDVKNCVASYLPSFNRCVIFATSDISYHGYSKITVPEGVLRNSFYSYFYTPITDRSKVKFHDTFFKARPNEDTVKRTKVVVKENTKNLIKRSMYKLGVRNLFDKIENILSKDK